MPSNETPNPAITLPRPTRARYVVLAFLCSMAFVLYLDRVCIAQALAPMMKEFGWSNTQASLVTMAFTLAYGLFEVPTGRLGDRFGSRGVLTRIVLWWSAFTVLTGCVWDCFYVIDLLSIPLVFDTLTLLVLIRFLFGAGEAGAVPNAARVIKVWFPESERGRMQGWLQASMHAGGTIAPMVAAWIIDSPAGWRATFVIFGAVGLVWAALFVWWFRDKPSEHPAVNAAEIERIGAPAEGFSYGHEGVPWRAVAVHPNIWLLSFIITLSAFNSYFFFTWYPTYLQRARDVTNTTAGEIASLALLGATIGSLLGGYVTDRITRRAADRYRARRWLCSTAYLAAASCLFASVSVDSPWLSGLFCSLACMSMFCQLPTWWACTYDVAGKHPGALFGLLNSMGVIGALGSQYFFGAFADWRRGQGFEGRDQWDPAFYLSIGLLLVAGVLWQFVRRRSAVGETEHR
jgi:ACS family glucarate transporter-like MFS transporter